MALKYPIFVLLVICSTHLKSYDPNDVILRDHGGSDVVGDVVSWV